MKESEINYLDLSGYMFSGKSAFSDLLREFQNFSVPDYRTEFDLIRIGGGLAELRWAFVDNWSPLRADAALKKFKKTIAILSRSPKGIHKFYQAGFGYETQYPNIIEVTKEFVDALSQYSWLMKSPYSLVDLSPFEVFKTKFIAKIKKEFPWPDIDFNLTERTNFDLYAKRYVNRLLTNGLNRNSSTIVTHNALEPYNPMAGFPFFDNIKSIVVDRDIRDIYMTSITSSNGYNVDVSTFSKIAGSFDIDLFIQRQKTMRKIVSDKENGKVLRVNFEDLVFDYDKTVIKVVKFLGLELDEHKYKKEFFNPMCSIKNTKLWGKADKNILANILKIEKSLPEYCYL
ncbi:sulfotransferase domain-containing protein [Shewanella denitrificans]|nr:sulfotransferase domain-containing protein [Shewanella denitrificans]